MKLKYLIGFAATLILSVAIVWWPRAPRVTVDQVNHLIETELPSQATVAQVDTFLNSHRIEHSETVRNPELDSDFRDNPKLEGKRERIKDIVIGIIRDTESDFLVSWSISLNFYFDGEGRLVEYTIKKIGTGL